MFIKLTALGSQKGKTINYETLISVDDISTVIASPSGTTINMKGGGVLTAKEGLKELEKAIVSVLEGKKLVASCKSL